MHDTVAYVGMGQLAGHLLDKLKEAKVVDNTVEHNMTDPNEIIVGPSLTAMRVEDAISELDKLISSPASWWRLPAKKRREEELLKAIETLPTCEQCGKPEDHIHLEGFRELFMEAKMSDSEQAIECEALPTLAAIQDMQATTSLELRTALRTFEDLNKQLFGPNPMPGTSSPICEENLMEPGQTQQIISDGIEIRNLAQTLTNKLGDLRRRLVGQDNG